MTTVWIYTDTSKQVGDPHHLLVFADQDSANVGASKIAGIVVTTKELALASDPDATGLTPQSTPDCRAF